MRCRRPGHRPTRPGSPTALPDATSRPSTTGTGQRDQPLTPRRPVPRRRAVRRAGPPRAPAGRGARRSARARRGRRRGPTRPGRRRADVASKAPTSCSRPWNTGDPVDPPLVAALHGRDADERHLAGVGAGDGGEVADRRLARGLAVLPVGQRQLPLVVATSCGRAAPGRRARRPSRASGTGGPRVEVVEPAGPRRPGGSRRGGSRPASRPAAGAGCRGAPARTSAARPASSAPGAGRGRRARPASARARIDPRPRAATRPAPRRSPRPTRRPSPRRRARCRGRGRRARRCRRAGRRRRAPAPGRRPATGAPARSRTSAR